MSKLTPSIAAELERVLRNQRAALLGPIRARMHGSDDPELMALANNLEQTGDAADTADSGLDLALLDHELSALADIDAALKRLAEGVAGECGVCGADIPSARLLANPAAHTCIGCQETLEKHRGAHHAAL